MAMGTPISIPIAVLWSCFADGDSELVRAVVVLCDSVGISELANIKAEDTELSGAVDSVVDSKLVKLEEEKFSVGVAVDNAEVLAAADCPILLMAEYGYGSSAVTEVVSQQF